MKTLAKGSKYGLHCLFIITFFISCNYEKCYDLNEIIGRYENKSESSAINYVNINSDSTFVQYYQKNNLQLKNQGKWKFIKEKCEIGFNKWKGFGEYGDQECVTEGCIIYVKLKEGELVFSVDLPSEKNFIKQ